MQPSLINSNGTLLFQMPIGDMLTEKEAKEEQIKAIRENALTIYEKVLREVLSETMLLTISQTAELMCYAKNDKVHELIDLPDGHPDKLRCIPHETKKYRRVMYSELKRWAEAHQDPTILQRVYRFENKQKRRPRK